MPEYEVIWRMPIEADSAEEAASRALAIQRNPQSIATVFEVMVPSLNSVDEEDQRVVIDLDYPTCSHCGAVLVGEDCPNYGFGEAHA